MHKNIQKIKKLEGSPQVIKNLFSKKEIDKFMQLYQKLPTTVHNKKQNVIKKRWLKSFNEELENLFYEKVKNEIGDFKMDNLKDEKNLMVKVDVQGTEIDVLKSLNNNIKKFKLVQIELSLHEMYEQQVLWKEIVGFMNDYNFDIWTIYPGYKKKSIGQLYQFDVIFYNKQLYFN